jgi:DNA-directed DNA polymerase III PolC
MTYVPLRVHGHHSLLTGVDPPRTLLARARALGLPAMALADVDSLAGSVEFLQAAQHVPVRPILAAEISDPRPQDATCGASGRVVALASDARGYRNLCKLVSARRLGADPGAQGAALPGPESFDLLGNVARHSAGLIFLVDHPRLALGLFDVLPRRQLLVAISPASLKKSAARKASRPEESLNTHLTGFAPAQAFARPPADPPRRENDELETEKTPAPARAHPAQELIEVARATNLAVVAAPDVYYAAPASERDHRVRVAIKHNALLADLPVEWLAEQPGHLPGPREMHALYADLPDVPGDWPLPRSCGRAPGPLARTLLVADACRYAPELGGVHFPDIALESGETAYSRLCAIAFEGARGRYRPLRPEIVRRLDYELAQIERLGFSPYFLLVLRIADFARERAIPFVGRGSAADSLVAYCLGLTDADPLRYRLPFERFLNPARADRPDIDLDFCWRRRDEVLEHVYTAFGAHCTAMIATLCRFELRSAFREAALVEGIPPAEINPWSVRLPFHFAEEAPVKALPPELSSNPIARALRATPECRDFPFHDERFGRALCAAATLIDAPRHLGLHPGGVVVSPGPITDFTACQRAAKGVVMTQLDKDAVEAIGLVKMDLLGNRALTTIDDCLRSLRESGIELDLANIPEDDPATARTLREGRTLGCFQVESPGMRHLLKQTGAATMDDVIQAIALIRPGPAGSGMKDAYVRRFRGLEDARPPHPRLSELLWETRGIMLYQEDVMQVAALSAGMDLAEADLLRRALQKRRRRELPELRQRFLQDCERNGIERSEAAQVWERIASFAAFAFCKAHAVTYGRIAYRTVFLKTHHPAPYLAAFLASETGYYEPRAYVEECRRLGVPILPPDINRSRATFALEWSAPCTVAHRPAPQGCLRIGLGQIKGLSASTIEAIQRARAAGQPFVSLIDLLERSGAHIDEVERLIQCGALDAFDRTRPEMLWRLHLFVRSTLRFPKGESLDRGQIAACRAARGARHMDRARPGPSGVETSAHASGGGWARRGMGMGTAALARGETRLLFPEPATPALVLPGLPDLDERARGLLEFEFMGITVNAHPTALFACAGDERRARLEAKSATTRLIACRDLERFAGGRVALRGWLVASRRVRTVHGDWMRFLTLEDESGLVEAVMFPAVYAREGHRLVDPGPHCISGIAADQMGACTLHVERVW